MLNMTYLLLLEADAGDAAQICEILRRAVDETFQVTQVQHLEQALNTLKELPFDSVLFGLQSLDPAEAGSLQRLIEAYPEIPVIVLRRSTDERAALEAARLGAQDTLIKGRIDEYSLPRAIRHAIERKQTRKALEDSVERFRRLADNAPDLIFRYRVYPLPGFEYVNQAATIITGYTPEEFYADATLVLKIIHPADQHLVEQIEAGKADPHTPVVMRWFHKNGALIWAEQRTVSIFDQAGNLVAIEGIVRDISQRKQAEEALALSHQGMFSILESINADIYVADMQSCEILFVNQHMRQSFGPELIGKICWQVFRGGAGPCPHCTNHRLVDADGNPTDVIAWEGQNPITGRWYLNHDQAIPWVNGRLVRMQIATDITDRKLVEQERAGQLDRALRQQKALAEISLHEAAIEGNFEQAARFITDAVAAAIDTERVSIWLLDEAEQILQCIDLYEKTAAKHSLGQSLTVDDYPAYFAAFLSNQVIVASDARRDPRTKEFLDSYLDPVGITAMLDAAIRVRGRTIGVLCLEQTGAARPWYDDEIIFADAVGDHIATVWLNRERKQAEAVILRQAEEATALYETVHDLSEWQEQTLLLQTIVGRASALVRASSSGMYLFDPIRQELLPVYSSDSAYSSGQILRLGEGLAGRVAQTRQPLAIDDYHQWEGRSLQYAGLPIYASLAVPMLHGGELLGVLGIQETNDPSRRFDEGDVRLLSLFAGQAASAVFNARLLAETRQRLTELEVLYESGLAFSQSMYPQEIAEKLIDVLARKLEWHHAVVRLYHPETKTIEILVDNFPGVKDKQALQVRQKRISAIRRPGQGLSGWVIQQGQAVRSGDVHSDPRYLETIAGIRSGLYVPMKIGLLVKGVISVESEQPNAFSEADERLLTTLATQAAIALENASLLEKTLWRTAELSSLNEISRAIGKIGDIHQVVGELTERLARLLGAQMSALARLDPESGEIRALSPGFGLSDEQLAGVRYANQLGYKSWDLLKQGPFRANSKREIPGDFADMAARLGIESLLIVPLLIEQKFGGLVFVGNKPGGFNAEDSRLLNLVASQVGMLLEKASLFEASQRQVQDLGLLHAVATACVEATSENELLERATQVIGETLYSDDFGALLLNGQGTHLWVTPSYRGISEQIRNTSYPLSEGGVAAKVVLTGQPLCIPNVHLTADYWDVNPAMQSELCVPIKIGERVLGVINAESAQLHAFSQQDERLLSTLAGQLATAIERLRAEAAEHAQRQLAEALQKTAIAINSSLDYDTVMNLILENVTRVIACDAANIMIIEGEQAHITHHLGYEKVGYREWVEDARLELSKQPNLQRIIETKQPLLIHDTTHSPLWNVIPEGNWIGSYISAPILDREQVFGFLNLDHAQPGFFTESQLKTLQAFAEQAGLAIKNARLFVNTNRQLARLTALREIDRAISSSMDLRVTLNVLLQHSITLLGVNAADVLLMNPHSHVLEFAGGQGFRSKLPSFAVIRIGVGLAGVVAQERRPLILPDLAESNIQIQRKDLFAREDFRAYCGVPLLVRGQVAGVMEVFHRAPKTPDREWIDLLETLAGQTAIAVENIRLFDELTRSNLDLNLAYDRTLEGWVRTLSLRDEESEAHTRRVTDMTLKLAEAMGLRGEELTHIRRGAMLHDIGKIAVPDHLLHKHGPLTDEEWGIMRLHPIRAYELLSPIDYLRPAVNIPYCHHENWDGSGYPRGLKGHEIPLEARIFSVVDTWDSLCSERPYRQAWPEEKVRAYLQEQAGVQFDPDVVELFLSVW